MGEGWVIKHLIGKDQLVCHRCYKTLKDRKVYLYVDVDSEIDEVMCASCFFLYAEAVSKEDRLK